MTENRSRPLHRKFTAEHVLLFGLLVVSGYMFVESYSFRDPSGMFPRFIAGTTFVGALLLLLESYLPAPLQSFVRESADLFDSYEEELEEVGEKSEAATDASAAERADDDRDERDPATDAASTAQTESEERSVVSSPRDALENKRFVLSAMTSGYVVLCYLIGFLWASPLFVLSYSLWARHEWYVTAGLTAGAYGIVYGFMELLTVQLDTGVLVG